MSTLELVATGKENLVNLRSTSANVILPHSSVNTVTRVSAEINWSCTCVCAHASLSSAHLPSLAVMAHR